MEQLLATKFYIPSIRTNLVPRSRLIDKLNDGLERKLTLIWAPAGPGWPLNRTDWEGAKEICQYLDVDGLTLSNEPVNIWKLPSVEEVVRSMTRRRQNSGVGMKLAGK